MFKWRNILAVSLIVLGTLVFKWSDSIGARFQTATTPVLSDNQLATALTDKVRQSVLTNESASLYVELLSIGMLTTGVIWLTKRASGRLSDSRLVLDFSKKINRNKQSKTVKNS